MDISIFNGLKVKHKVFGLGTVTGVNGNKITIKFKKETKERIFAFPTVMQYLKVTSRGAADIKSDISSLTEQALKDEAEKEEARLAELSEKAKAYSMKRRKGYNYPLVFINVPYNFSGICSAELMKSNTHMQPCCLLRCRTDKDSLQKRAMNIENDSINGKFICPMNELREDGKVTIYNKKVDVEPGQRVVLTAKTPSDKLNGRYLTVVGVGTVQSVSTLSSEQLESSREELESVGKIVADRTEIFLNTDEMKLFDSELVNQIGDALSKEIVYRNYPIQKLKAYDAYVFLSKLLSLVENSEGISEVVNSHMKFCLDSYKEDCVISRGNTKNKINQEYTDDDF